MPGAMIRFTVVFYFNSGRADAYHKTLYHNASSAIEASSWAREEAERRFKDMPSVPTLHWRVY